MPTTLDLQNIITTITYSNLSNLAAPTPTLRIPAGLENLYITTVFNNFTDFGIPADIQDVVKKALTSSDLIIIPL
jgi:hypothetical protein